jgi:hypothetical protein
MSWTNTPRSVWLSICRVCRIAMAVARVFDAQHCINEANSIFQKLCAGLHAGLHPVMQISVAIQAVALIIWAVDALVHAYRAAQKLLDEEPRQ